MSTHSRTPSLHGSVLGRRVGAVAAVAALALPGCTAGGELPAEPTTPPAEDKPAAGEDSSPPGGQDPSLDPTDPGSHYLFLPILDAAETVTAEEIGSHVSSFLQASVADLDCPGAVELGEVVTCTGASLDGEGLVEVADRWDVALVRTTNANTALIVRAAEEGSGEFPLHPEQLFHFAYLVGEEPPEVIAAATEEGFRATQVSNGPSEVEVTVSCEGGEEIERSALCEVEGERPADAAGTWLGVGHDSFVEDSAVYLFVEQPVR